VLLTCLSRPLVFTQGLSCSPCRQTLQYAGVLDTWMTARAHAHPLDRKPRTWRL
jgi:hypothetical protein